MMTYIFLIILVLCISNIIIILPPSVETRGYMLAVLHLVDALLYWLLLRLWLLLSMVAILLLLLRLRVILDLLHGGMLLFKSIKVKVELELEIKYDVQVGR